MIMKKLFVALILLFLITPSVLAQEPLMLATTRYQTYTDLQNIFTTSTRVLNYLEGEDIEAPFALFLLTENQRLTLANMGFDLTIIDPDAEITTYILLYHPLPDQANKLTLQGSIYPLSRHVTLLKLPPGEEFVHEGVASEFFEMPFQERVLLPTIQTKRLEPNMATRLPATQELRQSSRYLLLVLSTILVILGGGFILLTRHSFEAHPRLFSKAQKTLFATIVAITILALIVFTLKVIWFTPSVSTMPDATADFALDSQTL